MKLLTVKEVAPILQVTEWSVYEMVKKGILPGVRLGKNVRISEDALRRFIENGGRSLEEIAHKG